MKDRELFVWFHIHPATKSGRKIGFVYVTATEITRGKKGWQSCEWLATREFPSRAEAQRAVKKMKGSKKHLWAFLKKHWFHRSTIPSNGRRMS